MEQAALVLGGPGSGKTSRALEIMDMVLKTDVRDPLQIGFISFTRAARREASSRAGAAFGIAPEVLEHQGWFRTVHSVCHRLLQVQGGQLLTDDALSRAWLRETLQADDEFVPGDATEQPEFGSSVATTIPGKVLSLWDLARNRLLPFRAAYEDAWSADKTLPPFEDCWRLMQHYEAAKRRDGKLDFCDLLLRVAGMHCDGGWPTDDPRSQDIELPSIPVWFIDEAQDNSKLMDWVCARITENARWVYVFGDPLQAIYGWSGGDHRAFLRWDYAHKQILPISHRCPSAVLRPARAIARRTADWFDHDFAPRAEGGTLNLVERIASLVSAIDPTENTLVLARSNHLASKLAGLIDEAAIPWHPTRGRGGFNSPRRVGAALAALDLRAGKPITPDQWGLLLNQIPVKVEGKVLLSHGTKARFADPDYRTTLGPATLAMIADYGGTEDFQAALRSERWCEYFQEPARFRHIVAASKYGDELMRNPRVRVGTIHSVKGAEADHVLLWTATSEFLNGQLVDPARFDEERRVWYVAHTRARQRMTVARGDSKFRFTLHKAGE